MFIDAFSPAAMTVFALMLGVVLLFSVHKLSNSTDKNVGLY